MGVGGQRHATPRPLYPRERSRTHCIPLYLMQQSGFHMFFLMMPAQRATETTRFNRSTDDQYGLAQAALNLLFL